MALSAANARDPTSILSPRCPDTYYHVYGASMCGLSATIGLVI